MHTIRILVESIFRWLYWYPLRLIIQNLPMKVSYAIAGKIGAIYCFLMRGMKDKVIDGVRLSFKSKSDKELNEIAEKTFEEKALSSIEAFYYPMLSSANIGNIIKYEGLEYLDKALFLGKGVILCHAHFGNEELLMPAIGYKGYKVNQIASRREPEKVRGFFGNIPNYINKKAFEKRIGYRETFPVTFHYVDKSLRSVYRCLEDNEVFLIAADGLEGARWIKMRFLNRHALFSPGMFSIAQRTGSPVLPLFLVRQGDFTHRLIIEKPLLVNGDMEGNIRKFLERLEAYITKYPCHYAKVYWLKQPRFED